MANEKQRLWLTFSSDVQGKPLLCQLAKQFDVVFTIHNASVTKDMGIIAIEVEGDRAVVKDAIVWLKENGVQVDPVEIQVIEG
ncbi:MAG: NIL domain-containing protein [Verrucomicrobiota bacterium]